MREFAAMRKRKLKKIHFTFHKISLNFNLKVLILIYATKDFYEKENDPNLSDFEKKKKKNSNLQNSYQ